MTAGDKTADFGDVIKLDRKTDQMETFDPAATYRPKRLHYLFERI